MTGRAFFDSPVVYAGKAYEKMLQAARQRGFSSLPMLSLTQIARHAKEVRQVGERGLLVR